MMLLLFAFLLPILYGGLLVHLCWPEQGAKALIFKSFLGILVGLGVWSLLYFLYMLLFAGQHWFLLIQLSVFLGLLIIVIWRGRKGIRPAQPHWRPTRTQLILAGAGLLIFVTSLLSTGSYLLRRKQGDWDAWMMYNRAARFVYRDPVNWLDSFSRQIDPIFHADYPLLLAMNIASGWDLLGAETPHVPMLQSALFSLACAGLLFSSLALVKSAGQACLGLIVLWGTPALVNEGAREMADLPLATFILATFVLIYLYKQYTHPGLLGLAGLSSGLAAWTKNEGSLFVIAAGLALMIAFLREKPWRILLWYAAGLVFPLAIVVYFKLFLAPPSDVLSNGLTRSIQQILETSRHVEILQSFGTEFLTFGSWPIAGLAVGMIPILVIYYLIFRERITRTHLPLILGGLTILIVQELGNYGIYTISPYDLTWHLGHSIERIFLQIFPLLTFLVLSLCRTPESIFASGAVLRKEASHAIDD